MKIIRIILVSVISIFWSFSSVAQRDALNVRKLVMTRDSLFWMAYNACDSETMRLFLSDDIEFYHDKGGVTKGIENFIDITKKNLCGNDDFRLRRKAVDGSVTFFPMANASVLYGGIVSGEHVFYVNERGKDEVLDGRARFTHLWIWKDNVWKMSRVLSYDHKPAGYENRRKSVSVSSKVLDQIAGEYNAPGTGICKISHDNDKLSLAIGNQQYVLYPESEISFFVTDRDLTFNFQRDSQGNVINMSVVENGKVVEKAVRVK
jgi:hypothetical protein